MFKANNKNTRTTPLMSFCCIYYWLGTYFTPFFSISIANFEPENEYEKSKNISYFFLNSSNIE